MNQIAPPPSPAAKPPSARTRVKRLPKRAHYDAATLHAVLDAGYVCHIAFTDHDKPIVIPTAYWREGDHLYIHGSSKSRMAMALATGIPACVAITLLDGLVFARTSFNHSMNYRSVVAFGSFEKVPDDHKLAALEAFTQRIAPGRWADIRGPNKQEFKATMVLRMPLTEAGVKIRSGPNKDDPADMGIMAWTGVLPFRQGFDAPVPDPEMKPGIALPDYVRALTSR